MRYTESFEVAARREVAFDYVADGANSLAHHPAGTSIVRQPAGDIGLGTRFWFERPGEPSFVSTITKFEPPDALEFESASAGQHPTRALWRFLDLGMRTRLEVETESSFVGPRWVAPLAGLLTLAAWPLLMIKMASFRRLLTKEIEATEARTKVMESAREFRDEHPLDDVSIRELIDDGRIGSSTSMDPSPEEPRHEA